MSFPRRCVLAVLVSAVAASACAHGSVPRPGAAPSASSVTSSPRARANAPPGNPAIDVRLRAEWTKVGVVPASRADDATFLRRVWVDLVGSVPPPEATIAFLSDPASDKRSKLVESLLSSAAYADHWTNYWDDVLMGDRVANSFTDRGAFREWLRSRFASNVPWDRIVSDLVSATGQNGLGGRKVRGPSMQLAPATSGSTEPPPDPEVPSEEIARVNAAVNFALRYEQTPQDLGGVASRIFLGVQIQCAQCHDHKSERWTQEDFRRFSSAFFRAKVEPIDKGGTLKRVALVDAPAPLTRFAKNPDVGPLARAKPTALDGTDLERGPDTRKALAAWITSKKNPWFAKAFVNRIWGHLLGRGFYDPVDDVRASNAPSAPELLDQIAADFVAHDFDVKYLLRTVCATEAYQLASAPGQAASANASGGPDPENKLWGRFHLVPLGPEELLNALVRATDLEKTARESGVADFETLRASIVKQYAFLFDTDEGDDVPDYSGTVSQALALLNGALVGQGGRALPGSMLRDVMAGPGETRDKVDRIAVTVLARHATPAERETWARYVDADEPPAASVPLRSGKKPSGPLERLDRRRAGASLPKQSAYEDVVWAMLNSSEFTFNH